ncbi:MAG: hypothetical protein LUC95_03250 [Lachnospiraceae bacterium]|nr:hypothetical protein [Lachnospiraceae bacterium]
MNKGLRVIVALQAVVLLVLFIWCFRSGTHYVFTEDDFLVKSGLVSLVSDEEGVSGYGAVSDEALQETVLFTSESFSLAPGAYRVSIAYHSQVNYLEGASISSGLSYLNLVSEGDESAFDFEPLLLRDGTDAVEQTVQIHALRDIEDLYFTVSFYGLGEVTVYAIEVEEVTTYRVVCLLGAMLLFATIDGIGYLLLWSDQSERKKEVVGLLLICLAGVLPFCADFVFHGHDTTFHVQRIVWLAKELSNGNLFPAIYSSALNGYGYAAPLFYCPLFLYLPALLYNCGCPMTFVYNLYLSGMTVLTCLIMYYSAFGIFKKRNPALLASALYTLSAVRLTNIFTRAAFGELTAQTFLPLAVLGFYRIYAAPKGEKIRLRQYWPLVVGLTGVIASHVLTTVMTGMVILAVCLMLAKRTLERPKFSALLKAALLTFGTAAAILVPMLISLRMDLKTNQTADQIQEHGTYLLQVLQVIVNNYQGDSAAGSASGDMSLSIGFPLTLGLVIFLVCMVKRSMQEKDDDCDTGFMTACWGLTVLFILLSGIGMFYDYLCFLPDLLYRVLTIYQFPWRWLVFAVLFASFGTAAVSEQKEALNLFGTVPAAFLIYAALILNTGQIYADQLTSSQLEKLVNQEYAYFNEIGNGEYLLSGTDLSEVYYRELNYDETVLSAGDYRYEENSWRLEVKNLTDEAAAVDIPLFCYDNFTTYDMESGEQIVLSTGENNRVRLAIPAGYSGTVVVKYQLPLLWKMAVVVSVATDLALAGYLFFYKRKGSSDNS